MVKRTAWLGEYHSVDSANSAIREESEHYFAEDIKVSVYQGVDENQVEYTNVCILVTFRPYRV